MNYKKLIKGLLYSIAISFTYGETCKEINAYAISHNIDLTCNNNGPLEVMVHSFLKEEAKEDFIQKFLFQFPNIEILDISYHHLTCELIIPVNSNLRELHATANELSGKLIIPENSKLEYLDVSNNYSLTGELNIPKNSNLKKLYACFNKLTGSVIIPENSKLEILEVCDNNLSGQLIIPKNSNLKELHVSDNNLTGNITIPENLIDFHAQNNQLSGDIIIPENSKLEKFYAPNNKFNGKVIIPKNISNLEEINISDNELKGELTIPENSKIKELDASGNDIHVSCDSDIYETDTHYCKMKIKKEPNYWLIVYVTAIVIVLIILVILIILENKNKRKLSKKNKSYNKLTENTNVQTNSFKVGKCYIASSNYVPNKEDEIAISVGDRISIIEVLDNDRAYGKNEKTNQSGNFPLSCLKNEIIKETKSYKSAIKCLTLLLCLIILIPILLCIFIYILFALTWKGD